MNTTQRFTRWWQQYVRGVFKTPQDLVQAARAETPDKAQSSDRWLSIPEEDLDFLAPARLQAPSVFTQEMYLKQGHKADWTYVPAPLQKWAALTIEYARRRQIPLYVHCALRDEIEQERVYTLGHSRVKYPNSAHNIGEAVDIVHSLHHWDMTRKEWDLIHYIGRKAQTRINSGVPKAEQLQLDWGGDWHKPWDPAHWQITGYYSRLRPLPPNPLGPKRATPRHILAHA